MYIEKVRNVKISTTKANNQNAIENRNLLQKPIFIEAQKPSKVQQIMLSKLVLSKNFIGKPVLSKNFIGKPVSSKIFIGGQNWQKTYHICADLEVSKIFGFSTFFFGFDEIFGRPKIFGFPVAQVVDQGRPNGLPHQPATLVVFLGLFHFAKELLSLFFRELLQFVLVAQVPPQSSVG